MITTLTKWRLEVHFRCQILLTGGASKRKCPQCMPISSIRPGEIFSFLPSDIGVEASVSVGWDDIVRSQSKTGGETTRENMVLRQSVWADTGILPGDDPVFDTTNTENNSGIWKEEVK
jgi:hypothetical protein